MASTSAVGAFRIALLKDEPKGVDAADDAADRERQRKGKARIRCPRCAWEPGPHDRWMCLCLHIWNTFDTGGVCPGCSHRWVKTQCLRCTAWSRHEDWYVEEGDPL